MDRRLLVLLLSLLSVPAAARSAPFAASKPAAQRVPRMPDFLRGLAGKNRWLGQLVHVPDAALYTARTAERLLRRSKNPIPELTLVKFRKLTATPELLAASIKSGELPTHFRLLYPHRSDPRTTQNVIREVDIHLPDNAVKQLRQRGGLRSITNLHGYTSDAIEQEAISNMNELGGTSGLVAIHPQGILAYDKMLLHDVRSWNTPACCGPAQEHGFRDIEFLRALHTTLGKAFQLQRRALTGESNGGFMSYHARRELDGMFDAVFPVVGTEPVADATTKVPKKLTPTYSFLGDRDVLVNRLTAFVLDAEHPVAAAENVMRENGSVKSTTRNKAGTFTETVHRDADGRVVGAVRQISALGFGSHFWPGFEHTTRSIIKTALKEFRLADRAN